MIHAERRYRGTRTERRAKPPRGESVPSVAGAARTARSLVSEFAETIDATAPGIEDAGLAPADAGAERARARV
jgi:hypothetical protein